MVASGMRVGLLLVVGCASRASPPPEKPPEPYIPVALPVEQRLTVAPAESSLTADTVLAAISSSYLTGIKRCYKERLKVDAEARGKVMLAFKVDEHGKTGEPAASGFEPGVDACITAQMPSWAFPIPKDQDGEPTEATFRVVLQLVPE